MKILKISLIFGLLAFASCNKDVLNPESDSKRSLGLQKTKTLLSKRISQKRFVLSNKKLSSLKSSTSTTSSLPPLLQPQDYLGRSYRGNASVIVEPENVSFKVIEIERLFQDHPDYYTPLPINKVSSLGVSFASFDRYENKTNSNSTITGGFSLNLGLFSLGAKKKWTTVFSSSVINENNRVFGELNVEVKGDSYSLLSSTNSRRIILENYLSPTFRDEVNNSPRAEFIQNFGAFVLARYYTGGKATAMYTGTDNRNTTSENKEKAMDGSINATFNSTVKDTSGTVGGSLGFGNGKGQGSNESHNVTDLRLSIRTIGGDKGLAAFTVPKKIEDINIGLGEWVSSLNDRAKYNLIGLEQGGLNPISDYVMEANFKKSIELYIKNPNQVLGETSLYEPFVWIRFTVPPGYSGPANNVLPSMFLITRFGDFINITPSHIQPMSASAMTDAFFESYIAEKKPFFDLDYFYGGDIFNDDDTNPTPVISLVGVEVNAMRKFYHSATNTTYLLYSGGGKKYALSIHDDFILDTYGIRSWVNSMPITSISFTELQNYKVIGL